MNNKFKAICLGSEGYQIVWDNDGIPAGELKEHKERLRPIATLHGSFEFQRGIAPKLATVNDLYEALKAIIDECPNPKLPYGIKIVEIAQQALAKAEGV
jgi:hypothetical protein